MLEEKRNSTVLRQFWFVDGENTLPAIMGREGVVHLLGLFININF